MRVMSSPSSVAAEAIVKRQLSCQKCTYHPTPFGLRKPSLLLRPHCCWTAARRYHTGHLGKRALDENLRAHCVSKSYPSLFSSSKRATLKALQVERVVNLQQANADDAGCRIAGASSTRDCLLALTSSRVACSSGTGSQGRCTC